MTEFNVIPQEEHPAGATVVPAVSFGGNPATVAVALRAAKALLSRAAATSSHLSPDPEATLREAALEAMMLLGHVLGLSRAQLYTNANRVLYAQEVTQYQELLGRRLLGEPVAYIIGHREFFALDFVVDPRVLVPRPETEFLVGEAIDEARHLAVAALLIADIGTGSGAIAISLAKHLPEARVYATDLSTQALAVAATNCQRHHVAERVTLVHGDLLAPLPEAVHIIVANLPYIAPEQLASLPATVAHHEPHIALLAPESGLALYRRLFDTARPSLLPGGVVIVEIDPAQAPAIEGMAKSSLPVESVRVGKDYAGHDRYAVVRTARGH